MGTKDEAIADCKDILDGLAGDIEEFHLCVEVKSPTTLIPYLSPCIKDASPPLCAVAKKANHSPKSVKSLYYRGAGTFYGQKQPVVYTCIEDLIRGEGSNPWWWDESWPDGKRTYRDEWMAGNWGH